MLITDVTFEAFLNCPTKAWLKVFEVETSSPEYANWKQQVSQIYEEDCCSKLQSVVSKESCFKGIALDKVFDNRAELLLNCHVQKGKIQSRINALGLVSDFQKYRKPFYSPIRFISRERLIQQDKLLLGFDAFVLSRFTGFTPPFGKIIHGYDMKAVKINLVKILPVVHDLVEELEKQQNSPAPPPLVLNKHCAECEFQNHCRKEAISKDDLSLLSAMTRKERDKLHEKGIFSITQLPHTFRPRRKNRHSANRHENYSHALRALSIREQKIHVIGMPELGITGNPVYLDVEGKPDEDFYYLVGMRFSKSGVSTIRSFWADEIDDEEKLWISFLNTLYELDSPQLIYYGSYEKTFLEKMRQRYGERDAPPDFLDQVQARAINLVSILYAQIYFPTYSNTLKEIGKFLGFQWTDNISSGITSIMWRSQWEARKDHNLKEKLLTYNAEDCEAIERLTHFLLELKLKKTNFSPVSDEAVIDVDSLKPSHSFQTRFGKTEFVLPEFDVINKAAYWDYQQEKVYFRSRPQRKRASIRKRKLLVQETRINKVILLDPPKSLHCPRCQKSRIVKNGKHYKIVHDIKFGKGSVKRWIVKYHYYRYRCQNCGFALFTELRPWTGSKYGHNLIAYAIYNIIDLQISQSATAKNIQQIFGFSVGDGTATENTSKDS